MGIGRMAAIAGGVGVVAVAALWLLGAGTAKQDDRNAIYKSHECAIYYDNLVARLRNAGDRAGAEAATEMRDTWEEALDAVEFTTKVPRDEVSAIARRAREEHKRQMAQGDWAAYEKHYARQCS